MTDLIGIIGASCVVQALLLYWAYGAPWRFDGEGIPRDYVAAGRPEEVRQFMRLFRAFSRGATALLVMGVVLLIIAATGVDGTR